MTDAFLYKAPTFHLSIFIYVFYSCVVIVV